MKKLIILTTVFFTFFSCKKKYQPIEIPCALSQDTSLAKKYIKGTWEWVEEKRFNQVKEKSYYFTPITEGYTLRMIVGDSTVSLYQDSDKTDYKYKILLWKEITNFSGDNQPALVLYRVSDGVRAFQVPIKICNEYLLQQYFYVSSSVEERIWKKL